MIVESSHPRVRAARRCHTASGRRKTGRFLAEGPQAAREALGTPDAVVEVLATPGFLTAHAADPVFGRVAAPVHPVSDSVLAAVAETTTPQGVVAVCRDVTVALDALLGRRLRLVVLLAQVRDPGNAGTIIRTADAAGADGVILSAGSVDPLGGKCVRSTAGSLFHLPVVVGQPPAVVAQLQQAGLTVLVADSSGAHDLHAPETEPLLSGPTAWIVGNEARGVPGAYADRADAAVRVPVYGRAESLNASVAAAVCLYASAAAHHRTGAGDRPAEGAAPRH